MSRMPSARPASLALLAAVSAFGLAACAGGDYSETRVPTPSASASSPSSTATATPAACTNATQTYDALPSNEMSSQLSDDFIEEIRDRGRLRVGVSADSYLLGANNPLTGRIEGFDIDIAKAIAKELLGEESKVSLIVLTAADRIPALQEGRVDIVARNMTMTCDRWTQIAFSSEYYHAGQKVLVTREVAAERPGTRLADLTGQRVCAPTGTTSLAKLKEVNEEVGGIEIVTAGNHTGCLVLFQQGQADAITGDDTVLAGLAAQDLYAQVTEAEAITDEPYGLGINKENVYFVRYVNAVLEQLRNNGEWTKIYNRWFAESLGKAPKPPTAVYGR